MDDNELIMSLVLLVTGGWVKISISPSEDQSSIYFFAEYTHYEGQDCFSWTSPKNTGGQDDINKDILEGLVSMDHLLDPEIFQSIPESIRQKIVNWADNQLNEKFPSDHAT